MENKNIKIWEPNKEKREAYKEAVNFILENETVFFMNDVAAYMPFSRRKFFYMFPIGSPENEEIKRLLGRNRLRAKMSMRGKMYEMNSPTTMIALYRLIGDKGERTRLSASRPMCSEPDDVDDVVEEEEINEDGMIDLQKYVKDVKQTLKKIDRYSPALDFEIEAMAAAWATLQSANRTISRLTSTLVKEETSQGVKMVQHPAYALQMKALDNMATHAKLLGLDFENAPDMATEGPLVSLTKEMISYTKAQSGHMSVDKSERKKGKNSTEKCRNRMVKGENGTKRAKNDTKK